MKNILKNRKYKLAVSIIQPYTRCQDRRCGIFDILPAVRYTCIDSAQSFAQTVTGANPLTQVSITDIAALIGIFGANMSMILFGWLMEKYEQPGKPDWTAFIFGCIAGIFPWLAIADYLWGPGASDMTPSFGWRKVLVPSP